jgi:glycerol-3-phosphate acyltransferase PlsY
MNSLHSFVPAGLLPWLPVAFVVLAYLLGSLSFAVIVSRLMGLSDPRSYGSGNPGATNVLRSGSKKAAIATLVLDALKGWLPVWWVGAYGQGLGLGEGTQALVGLAAFVGHVWPVFFRFEGGKGVATAAGVLLGFDLILGGGTLFVWVAVAGISRYSSLAALSAAVAAPAIELLVNGSGPLLGAVVVMALILVIRHRANIEKLIAGKESKLGQKGATSLPVKPSQSKARRGR